MNSERFLKEFCSVNIDGSYGDVMVHPEDLLDYQAVISGRSDGSLVLNIQIVELRNYFATDFGSSIKNLRRMQSEGDLT